jgi:hypothetical protein
MKVFITVLTIAVTYSCISHSEEEYALQAEKMCKCVQIADSASKLDTLKQFDYSDLNFARCASSLEVDPNSEAFISALKTSCSDLKQRHAEYLENAKKDFTR